MFFQRFFSRFLLSFFALDLPFLSFLFVLVLFSAACRPLVLLCFGQSGYRSCEIEISRFWGTDEVFKKFPFDTFVDDSQLRSQGIRMTISWLGREFPTEPLGTEAEVSWLRPQSRRRITCAAFNWQHLISARISSTSKMVFQLEKAIVNCFPRKKYSKKRTNAKSNDSTDFITGIAIPMTCEMWITKALNQFRTKANVRHR